MRKTRKKILESLYDVILPNNKPGTKIIQPVLRNPADAIRFMNRLALIYFNFHFHHPIHLFEDRYIVPEIDDDKLGFLFIAKSLKDRQGIAGTHFDYLAHRNGREITELFFECKIGFKKASGSIRVVYEKNRVSIRGNSVANELKRYLFGQLYQEDRTDGKFQKILNHALDQCEEVMKEGDQEKLDLSLRQILLTESVWEGFSKETAHKYQWVKEFILAYMALAGKNREVDQNLLRLLMNSCRFIVNHPIQREGQDYLYPYITVYADKEGTVTDIRFEDLKSSSSTGTFIEFVVL